MMQGQRQREAELERSLKTTEFTNELVKGFEKPRFEIYLDFQFGVFLICLAFAYWIGCHGWRVLFPIRPPKEVK